MLTDEVGNLGDELCLYGHILRVGIAQVSVNIPAAFLDGSGFGVPSASHDCNSFMVFRQYA
jgi:hypothetical protein